MLRPCRLMRPRTIAGQIFVLVAVSVIFFHLTMTTARHVFSPGHDGPRGGRHVIGPIVEFVRVLEGLSERERPAVVAAMARAYPHLGLTLHEPSEDLPKAITNDPGLGTLHKQLRSDLSVFTLAGTAEPASFPSGKRVGITFPDGATITAALPRVAHKGPPASTLILGSIGFMGLNLAVLLWWATRGLTAPLSRLAQAAAGFSLDRDAAPLPERGPYEVRTAARALNRMRERIRRMVEDRTRMLAAVGHDLRTPITRLRLRAEFLEDETTRAQMLRDLDQMSAMIHAALSYLRDGQTAEGRSLVDLASLLQTVCDEFTDMGHAVTYEGPDHLLVLIRSDEIHRAVTNLVENAMKFGTRAVVRLRVASPATAEIEVVDNGPGIPDADKEAMLEPFARGDAARGMNEPSGFGLGLSITRAIGQAHGGGLSLLDAEGGGLIVRLSLPIPACAGESSGPGRVLAAA